MAAMFPEMAEKVMTLSRGVACTKHQPEEQLKRIARRDPVELLIPAKSEELHVLVVVLSMRCDDPVNVTHDSEKCSLNLNVLNGVSSSILFKCLPINIQGKVHLHPQQCQKYVLPSGCLLWIKDGKLLLLTFGQSKSETEMVLDQKNSD